MTSTSIGRRLRVRRALLSLTTVLSLGIGAPALAQLAAPVPVRQALDANGVDLFNGTLRLTAPALSMGQGDPQGLVYAMFNNGSGWTDNVTAALNLSGTTMIVNLGGKTDTFTVSGTIYLPTEGNGATLIYNSTTNVYTYTAADGTVIHFDKNRATNSPYYSNAGRATDLLRPSGVKLVYSYSPMDYCRTWKPGGNGSICTSTGTIYILNTIRNSYGYQISLQHPNTEYIYDSTTPEIQPNFAMVSKVTGATMTNLAVASGASTPTETLDDTPIGGVPYFSVTDPMGRVTKYRMTSGLLSGITRPASTSEDVTIGYTSGLVSSIATPAGTTSYARSDASGVRTVTVTDPLSHATVYTFDIASQRMTGVTDPNGHATGATYDTSGRLTRVTRPESNYTQVTYDARGNITENRTVAKSGSGLSDIVSTAGYDISCANTITCNRPNWTKDAKGNQTDYAYEATHGDLLSVTLPAPTTGAVRPQTRLSYSTLQAYFKNSSGSIVASGEPVTRLTGTSACQTASSCTGTADEVKASVSYGPQTTGVGNNLLPVSASKGSGDGALTATTAYAYDDVGNLLTVDGPLAGTADTTRYRYDAGRALIGTVSADPDGAGPLKNRARRTIIDARGLVTRVENGTVNSQSDADWTGFAAADAVDATYDTSLRPATAKLSSGATDYALTQTSYDAAGQVQCVAQRMNTAVYASLPASACTLGTSGSFGSDQIAKTLYDNAGQVTQVRVAFGTADEAPERTLAYSNNGQLISLTDGETNKTSYVYDGFDRLAQTLYPSPTKGAGTSNASDFEQLSYDANSSVISRRLRDATSIAFTFDALNRLTSKDLPGTEPDVTYAYDSLGRMISASQAGNALSFTYDALGRNLTQVGPQGTVSAVFDLAGRRTQLTYPGSGLYVNSDFLVTGETSAIRENGATSGVGVLATFAFDNLGRRTSLIRGNGTVTSYTFDPVSRLASLGHDLAGTTNDVSTTFSYSPASQIMSLSKTNDLYAWTGHGLGTTGTVTNGHNQLATVGGTSAVDDARGNLTTDPTTGKTYSYSSENLLTSASGGVSLSYDPALRLYQIAGAATTRFAYDGADVIAEYDGSSSLLRRYIHGPGVDEPLVQYEGSGMTDRRFLHADERGSIVATSDSSGNMLSVNRYDEYGKPQATNVGRFQYTGQKWIPELGLYDYKARMYAPHLGRFMQSDPMGYGDGPNSYGYTRGDPANGKDPSGTLMACTGSIVQTVDCSGVPFLSSNGIDTAAARMQQEMGLSSALPGASAGIVSGVLDCIETPGCVSATLAVASLNLSDAISPQNNRLGLVLVSATRAPPGLGGGPFKFADSFQQGGFPFYGIRINGNGLTDTLSFTRGLALSSAKYINAVPRSAQPVMVYTPGLVGGGDGIGLDSRNKFYYIFLNASNQYIGIREDVGTSFQPPHFNSGLAGSLRYPSQDLNNHSYFGAP
ncbi:RHS repeat domain-containing protein [Sphingomonas sp. RB1R13]|uniref:RHS repeat domain-containing protein n=1 Tax=Sphingomonas sp. RB1R13 TaxID=3096159 RepID=UPI002FC9F9F4